MVNYALLSRMEWNSTFGLQKPDGHCIDPEKQPAKPLRTEAHFFLNQMQFILMSWNNITKTKLMKMRNWHLFLRVLLGAQRTNHFPLTSAISILMWPLVLMLWRLEQGTNSQQNHELQHSLPHYCSNNFLHCLLKRHPCFSGKLKKSSFNNFPLSMRWILAAEKNRGCSVSQLRWSQSNFNVVQLRVAMKNMKNTKAKSNTKQQQWQRGVASKTMVSPTSKWRIQRNF